VGVVQVPSQLEVHPEAGGHRQHFELKTTKDTKSTKKTREWLIVFSSSNPFRTFVAFVLFVVKKPGFPPSRE